MTGLNKGPNNSNRPYSISNGKNKAANKNTATKVGNKLENTRPPVSSEYIILGPTLSNVIHAKITAKTFNIIQLTFTLNALYNNPFGSNLSFKIVEQMSVKIADKVIIVTMIKGIAPPTISFSQLAKNATGSVVCFLPSCSTGIGIKNKIMPISDIVINLIRPLMISCLEYLFIFRHPFLSI